MKKILIIAATAFISLASFANVDPITGKVQEAFRTAFADAKNVKWTSLEDAGLFQATFTYQNAELNAYYNAEGEMVAIARYIAKENLPILVAQKIQERFPEHVMMNIIEHTSNGNTTYHMTLHSPKSSMLVNVTADGDISISKKIKNRL